MCTVLCVQFYLICNFVWALYTLYRENPTALLNKALPRRLTTSLALLVLLIPPSGSKLPLSCLRTCVSTLVHTPVLSLVCSIPLPAFTTIFISLTGWLAGY